ncbi:GTPase Era-like isoform X1 [Montipora capricornis]|uniref:GTPase Era-like isoform X1 n=1 Tax=Montipora capricornis TaxID=246305 RepID=UPI0035F15953
MANLPFRRFTGRKVGFTISQRILTTFLQLSSINRNALIQRLFNRDPVWCPESLTSEISGGSVDGETNRTSSVSNVFESGHDSHSKQESVSSKLIRVAIIGEANSGKSTLTNCLTGHKICAVTAVPHTTRKQTLGVFMMDDCQIVLLDTPGVVTPSQARRLKMTRQHVLAPREALEEADLIAVISDVSNKHRSMIIHESILESLKRYAALPSILILNKVDVIKQKMILLNIADSLLQDRKKDEWGNYKGVGGWSKFEQVFMISAASGDGVDDLKKYLAIKSKPKKWLYPPDTCTDQPLQEQIQEIFREKLLRLFEHEIPWQIRQVIVLCEPRDGHWRIHHKLYCRKKSQRRCVLEEIGRLKGLVAADLENLVGQPIHLTVDVSVSEKVGFVTPFHTY